MLSLIGFDKAINSSIALFDLIDHVYPMGDLYIGSELLLYSYRMKNGLYDIEQVETILSKYKRNIPYTNTQLAMMSYLKDYIKLSDIIAWCNTVYSNDTKPSAVRKAVERVKVPKKCSVLEFMHNYASVFSADFINVSMDDYNRAIKRAFDKRSAIEKQGKEILIEYEYNISLVGRPLIAKLSHEFNVSRSSLIRFIKAHESRRSKTKR